ncbi:MAG: hypothetical protein ACOYMD_01765 [Paludibacter sp.]
MKTRFIFQLIMISLIFSACNLNPESNYRPEIRFVQNPIANKTDTLNIYYTDNSGVFRLDTIQVGDTISFNIYVTGYSNHLKAFYITESTDSVSKIILPSTSSMDSIFLASSNYKEGKFLMKGTSTALYFPFQYIARKVSNEAKITFNVVSDANFEYNQNSFVLKTPIVAKHL